MASLPSTMLFYQLFEAESSTYTYLLGDRDTKEAVLIDPVQETVERDLRLLADLGLKLLFILETHVHADHITGADSIRSRTGGKTGISRQAAVRCADMLLQDGQILAFGQHSLKVLETPGHTPCSLSFYCGDRVFTGDTLLIRGTGRTDFQNGSAEDLFHSVRQRLFTLPPETSVYPAHDYKGHTVSSIAEEMQHNPRVGMQRSLAEFLKIMAELKLPPPKKINEAVPANLLCGKRQSAEP